jgi:hypothetical protein
MGIRVTCTGCHTRFDVSEKFAGKEGPCPKCKASIRIPALEDEVVIHAPEHSGPTDSKGRAVLKPIARSETELSAVQIALLAASLLAFFAVAVLLRFMFENKDDVSVYLMAAGALGIAMPIVYLAYTFLRNQDGAPLVGKDLWLRVAVCAVIYSALWLLMPLMAFAFPNNQIGAILALAGMILAGGTAAMLLLEFDYLYGILHYGMYLGVCLIGRLIVGVELLPGFGSAPSGPSTVISLLQSSLRLIF